MKILLTGATGFIGCRLERLLRERGHEVVPVGRATIDFAKARSPEDWLPLLDGIEVVVNTVGIFREQGRQRFAALHTDAPIALFSAAVTAGVVRVVQVSALGVEQGLTEYQRSKHAADRHLLRLPIDGVVAQPSLVFGMEGPSARFFLGLASLPLLPLPAGGRQPLQPVHIDDLVRALCALVEAPTGVWGGQRVPLVGPRRLTLAGYLQALRTALQLKAAPTLSVPAGLVGLGARLGDHLRGGMLDSASWTMLQQGNAASPKAITRLLGRPPRDATRFVPPTFAPAVRSELRLQVWLLPLLRLSMALVWIFTAAVSFGLYPTSDSYELLERTGIPPALQPLMLYGAAAFDLVLGLLTLRPPARRRWRRGLWAAQGLLMLFYMVVIALRLPEFWLHPYGPLLKNLPMLAVLVLLFTLDGGRPSRRPANPPREPETSP